MLKKELRLFVLSFFLTLLLCGWAVLFLWLDSASAKIGGGTNPPALRLSRVDALHYEVCVLGREYEASLEPFNRFEQVRKEYACLLTPRPVLAAEQLYGLAAYGWEYLYNEYKEEEYIQNVAKSQADVPVE